MIEAQSLDQVSVQVWVETGSIRLTSELRIEPDGKESLVFIVFDKNACKMKRFLEMKGAIAFANAPWWDD